MLQNVSISQMALSLLHSAASSKPMLSLRTGIVHVPSSLISVLVCACARAHLTYLYLGTQFDYI